MLPAQQPGANAPPPHQWSAACAATLGGKMCMSHHVANAPPPHPRSAACAATPGREDGHVPRGYHPSPGTNAPPPHPWSAACAATLGVESCVPQPGLTPLRLTHGLLPAQQTWEARCACPTMGLTLLCLTRGLLPAQRSQEGNTCMSHYGLPPLACELLPAQPPPRRGMGRPFAATPRGEISRTHPGLTFPCLTLPDSTVCF